MKACRGTWSRVAVVLLLALGMGRAWSGTVYLEYTDPQGTVLAEADVQGHIVARYDYRPYGGVVSGSGPNGPGYTGHVQDPETGLVYMQARYYQARGQFLSPDPVGPSPGDIFSFNRYAYANNNPIVNTDPTGMCVGHHGIDDPCSPEPTLPSSKPKPAVPNPTPQGPNAKALPTVTVTATALPIAVPISFGLGEIGGGLVIADPIPVIVVGALLYPTKVDAAPCEMPGAAPCGIGTVYNVDMPGDKGAEEWGRRHGVDPAEARRRFHGIKQGDTAHRGGTQRWTTDPDTGDVKDPEGEVHGNLEEER